MFLRSILRVTNNIKSFCSSPAMSEKPLLRKVRYDGRTKKRKWEERRSDKGEAFNLNNIEKLEERVRKRKYALLLGYSGSNYLGMQRNPTLNTIEEELFKALLATNHMAQDAFNQVQIVHFQRAARTDKGVSAARQVVSMKLPEIVDLNSINEKLPKEIRVFGCKRVTKGFNSKSQCDARTYFYMLPTLAFSKENDVNRENFRLTEDVLEEVSKLLEQFVGTKNYHNFTSKRKPNDPSSKRYIMSFVCEKPFVRENVEFVVLKVKGQSFILHQIRKMIGLTIGIIRGRIPKEVLAKVFTFEKVNVPRAPGLGLVLDFVHYDRYNRRYGDDGMHETLEWKELDDTVQEFKENHIYPTIINTEITQRSMETWLSAKLSLHRYDVIEEDDKEENENDDDDDAEDKNENATIEREQIDRDDNQIENLDDALSDAKKQKVVNNDEVKI